MRALVLSDVMYVNDYGYYDFTPRAWQRLESAGLLEIEPGSGQLYFPADLEDNGGEPDGYLILPEDRLNDPRQFDAIRDTLGVPEILVERLELPPAIYHVVADAIAAETDLRWVGYSKDHVIYVEG